MDQFQKPEAHSHSNSFKVLLVIVILFVLVATIFTVVFVNLVNSRRNIIICDCPTTTTIPLSELTIENSSNLAPIPLILGEDYSDNDEHTIVRVDEDNETNTTSEAPILSVELTTIEVSKTTQNITEFPVIENVTSTFITSTLTPPTTTTFLPTTPPTTTTTTNPESHTYSTISYDSSPNSTTLQLAFIRQMAREDWAAYRTYAWGEDGIQPLSKKPQKYLSDVKTGRNIVSALSTLQVMELEEEFNQARNWTKNELSFGTIKREVNVFLTIANYIGGMLSSYALTKEQIFLNKSKEIAEILDRAYDTSTGLPTEYVKPRLSPWDKPPASLSYLTDITASQLEYGYLYSLTKNFKYQNRLESIKKLLQNISKPNHGLYLETLNPKNSSWTWDAMLLGPNKPLYSHLIKRYIQSNRTDTESLELFKEAIQSLERNRMFSIDPETGLMFARCTEDSQAEYSDDFTTMMMFSDGCSLGATLALGARELERVLAQNQSIGEHEKRRESYRIYRYWELAEQITETCYQQSIKTKTGLAPRTFFIDKNKHEILPEDVQYELRPELAESYFVLWRLTHNPKYRSNAWQLVQSIYANCRSKSGSYALLEDVNKMPPNLSDFQSSSFLSGTLKFLYLTFTEDDVLPLDDWIFTEFGHPLPII